MADPWVELCEQLSIQQGAVWETEKDTPGKGHLQLHLQEYSYNCLEHWVRWGEGNTGHIKFRAMKRASELLSSARISLMLSL